MLNTLTASNKREWKAIETALTSEQWEVVFNHICEQISGYSQEDIETDIEMHRQSAYARGYQKNEAMVKAMAVISRLAYETEEYKNFDMNITASKTSCSGISKMVVSKSLKKTQKTAEEALLEEINAAFF